MHSKLLVKISIIYLKYKKGRDTIYSKLPTNITVTNFLKIPGKSYKSTPYEIPGRLKLNSTKPKCV